MKASGLEGQRADEGKKEQKSSVGVPPLASELQAGHTGQDEE